MTAFPEVDLISRLQSRDALAMSELYDRYGRLAYALILRMVRDVGTAEDLVQETFLRAWNRVQGFDARKGSLAPWLMAIARNRAIDYLRATGPRARNTVELDETGHPALSANMEQEALLSDNHRRLRAAMLRLLPDQNRALQLAYFEGLTIPETAARMGRPLGTVKGWIRMALKHLRRELAYA